MPYHDKCPLCSAVRWTAVLGGRNGMFGDLKLDHVPVLICSTRPEGPQFVSSNWTLPKEIAPAVNEFGAFCYGPLFSRIPVVDSKNSTATMYGVLNRSMGQLKHADEKSLKMVQDMLTTLCTSWDVKCDGLTTYHSKLRPEQRRKMQNAIPAFRKLIPHLTSERIKQLSEFTAFGKRELLTKRTTGLDEVVEDPQWNLFPHNLWSGDWAVEPHSTRAIQHLTPLANCLTGPAVQSMYGAMKKRLGLSSSMTLGSGYNATEIGVWMTNVPADWVFVEADASKYDGHQNASWFNMLANILGSMRHAPWWVREAVLAQRDSPTKLRDGTRFKVDGTMKSGSTFTTLLNSLVNIGILWLASRLAGIPEECCKFIVAGDDSVFAHDPRYDAAPFIREAGRLLGHELKVKVETLSRVKFLSSYFSPIVEEQTRCGPTMYKLTPEPGRMLTKFGWSLDFQPSPQRWLKECSQAAAAVYSGVPGFENIFGTASAQSTHHLLSENRKVEGLSRFRDDARIDFNSRYGVRPEDLEGLRVDEHRAMYAEVLERIFVHAGF